MSSRTIQSNPWPAQTAPATAPEPSSQPRKRSVKRRRTRDYPPSRRGSTSKVARQDTIDQNAIDTAKQNCEVNSGNDVISCLPTADTVVAQHEWTTFVWNSRRPQLTQTNLVDIYLFHGDSRQQILHFPQVQNPTNQAGTITAQVNDSWWGSSGTNWNGSNISYPFYWVLISSETTLDSNAIAQPIFTAVQTTFADSVIASRSSSAASAASASSASVASLSSLSRQGSATQTSSVSSSSASGNIQSSPGGSNFPHWAIAVIVVLGFLAIAATCVLAFLIIRRIRRRNAEELESNRNSMGSASPMMAHAGHSSGSPLLAAAAIPPRQPSSIDHSGAGGGQNAPSVISPDGASTISRAGSVGDSGPFSGADAAIMADAFRKMLRKPDFAPVEEGDSPENPEAEKEFISRELAEEGRDIRSVSSSRGVKVETMSESGDTIQENPR